MILITSRISCEIALSLFSIRDSLAHVASSGGSSSFHQTGGKLASAPPADDHNVTIAVDPASGGGYQSGDASYQDL
jgi:hypothetical protein